jgi:hypothetical protein
MPKRLRQQNVIQTKLLDGEWAQVSGTLELVGHKQWPFFVGTGELHLSKRLLRGFNLRFWTNHLVE